MRSCEVPSCSRIVFRTDKNTKLGYCQYHWKQYSTDIDKRPMNVKAQEKINRNIERSFGNEDLNEWFDRIAKEIAAKPYCWETGERISEKDYRTATCHIFPKSIFRSVATHELNYLILSPRNGSHDKTHRLDTFSKMNVFVVAIKRYNQFKHLITETHKYHGLFQYYADIYTDDKIFKEL